MVDFRISWDVEQVVTVGAIAVEVAVVVDRIGRTAVAGVNQAHAGVPVLSVVAVVECAHVDFVRSVVGSASHFRIVGVATSVVVVEVGLSH